MGMCREKIVAFFRFVEAGCNGQCCPIAKASILIQFFSSSMKTEEEYSFDQQQVISASFDVVK
jgi:hypothetical protein